MQLQLHRRSKKVATDLERRMNPDSLLYPQRLDEYLVNFLGEGSLIVNGAPIVT